MTATGLFPGAALQVLPSSVALLHPQEAAFEAMLAGWAAQQASRLLARGAVEAREAVVRRFARFTGEYPWRWQPVDVEDWTVHLRSGRAPAHSTLGRARPGRGPPATLTSRTNGVRQAAPCGPGRSRADGGPSARWATRARTQVRVQHRLPAGPFPGVRRLRVRPAGRSTSSSKNALIWARDLAGRRPSNRHERGSSRSCLAVDRGPASVPVYTPAGTRPADRGTAPTPRPPLHVRSATARLPSCHLQGCTCTPTTGPEHEGHSRSASTTS